MSLVRVGIRLLSLILEGLDYVSSFELLVIYN
jgi:hypothetical protein